MFEFTRYQLKQVPSPYDIRWKSQNNLWQTLAIEVRQSIGCSDEFDSAYAYAPAFQIKQVADGLIKNPDKTTEEAIIRLVWKSRRALNTLLRKNLGCAEISNNI